MVKKSQYSCQQHRDSDVVGCCWQMMCQENLRGDAYRCAPSFIALLLPARWASGQWLERCAGKARILLLTTFDTPELVVEGMRAGAAGYLLKDCSAEELCTAVRAVARGQVLLQASSAAQLLAGLYAQESPASRNASLSSEAEKMGLTARELEVVRLIAQGHSNTEIASELFVSDLPKA